MPRRGYDLPAILLDGLVVLCSVHEVGVRDGSGCCRKTSRYLAALREFRVSRCEFPTVGREAASILPGALVCPIHDGDILGARE